MVLALIFGFGVWAISTLQDNPIVEDTLSVRVARLGENQLGNTTWSGTLPVSITLTVRGARNTITDLNNSGLRMDVDLRSYPVGEHVIPLTPTLDAGPVVLLSVQPLTATIKVERIVQMRLPVRISMIGTPALGFRAGTPTYIPAEVVVTGTEQLITRIVSANAIVSVDGARGQVEQDVRVFMRDADGELVLGGQVVPEVISVRVPMEQLSNYRNLAVVVKRSGQPAEGYAVTDVSVDPVIVTIFGPVDVVQATKGYIETLEVGIEGAKAELDELVGLDIPPGVSLVSERQTSVRVRIRIQPLMGSRSISRVPVLLGLSSVYSATISPDAVDIVLNGPLPRLNNLADSDVIVELNVAQLGVGVHQLAPTVRVPEDITAQSVLPATIQVEIVRRSD